MYFLDLLTFLSDPLGSITGAIVHAVRSFFYMIDSIIYELIINLYNLFEILCNSRVLDNEVLNELTGRIGILLGIVMFFMVTFSFIKMLLEPDTVTDKNKGAFNIIKKVLIVIVMLGTSSFVFSGLYTIQKEIINSGVITKLLLPRQVETKNFGGALTSSLFTTFYNINPAFESEDGTEITDIDAIEECEYYVNLLRYRIYNNNDFELGYACLNESVVATRIDEDGNKGEQSETTIIKYTFGISTIVGILIVYFLIMYCISVGVRTVQLAFLEVLSPMAIISYLSPKDDNMFKKWLKVYISTYLDVFIRIAIINFVVFLIATILDNSSDTTATFWQSIGNLNAWGQGFVSVVMILALLTFAKKAPDLLKELFPVGSSKIGFGASMKDVVGMGALLGATASAGLSTVSSVPAAFNRAKQIPNAWNNMKNGISSASGFGGKAKAVGKGTLGLAKSVGTTAVLSPLGIAFSGVSGAIRGGVAGNSKNGVFSSLHAGQKAQAQANLNAANRKLSGATTSNRVLGFLNEQTGTLSKYDMLQAENSSYSSIKDEIDNDDGVKNAIVAYQKALGISGLTDEEFSTTDNGKKFKAAIDSAKESVHSKKITTDDLYKEKISKHNKRFGTNYGMDTSWETINNDRKVVKSNFEREIEKKK